MNITKIVLIHLPLPSQTLDTNLCSLSTMTFFYIKYTTSILHNPHTSHHYYISFKIHDRERVRVGITPTEMLSTDESTGHSKGVHLLCTPWRTRCVHFYTVWNSVWIMQAIEKQHKPI